MFQTLAQLHEAAPDPAFHRTERGADARSQLFIGRAVEKRRADQRSAPRIELLQALLEPMTFGGRLGIQLRRGGRIGDVLGHSSGSVLRACG